MSRDNLTVGDSILHRLKFLTIATVALYLVVGALAVNNTHSLCALRGNLEARVSEGKRYLRAHPNGTPGIPANAIRASIITTESSIRSLEVVPCL